MLASSSLANSKSTRHTKNISKMNFAVSVPIAANQTVALQILISGLTIIGPKGCRNSQGLSAITVTFIIVAAPAIAEKMMTGRVTQKVAHM